MIVSVSSSKQHGDFWPISSIHLVSKNSTADIDNDVCLWRHFCYRMECVGRNKCRAVPDRETVGTRNKC